VATHELCKTRNFFSIWFKRIIFVADIENHNQGFTFGSSSIDPLTTNGHYNGRTAPLTSRGFILNIYSTNIHTEYFKHAA
jgi:hypothetical protein